MRRDGGRPTEEPTWHDREPVALAAGVAAFALLALLALAVIRTSHDATNPTPNLAPVGSNGATTTTSPTVMPFTSSSYTVPSVQTSEDTGPPVTTSSEPPPAGGAPGGAPLYPEVSTPTTIFNPYATTTQGNAGHV